jgi:hypothetical protein
MSEKARQCARFTGSKLTIPFGGDLQDYDGRHDLFLTLSFAITNLWFNIFAVPSTGLVC